MGLLKKIGIHLDRKFRDTINDNVDTANREFDRLFQKDTYTNNRIDNLVLHAGGDNINEVVDARVNWTGDRFSTLQERLIAGEELSAQERLDLVDQIHDLREGHNQTLSVIQMLYGGNGPIELYVRSDGSDAAGDGSEERPFRTIQTAVNSLPLISTSNVRIWVEPAAYLEDVVVRGITAPRIEIMGTNNASVDATTGDTGVYVRSVTYRDCQAFCQVAGLQQTDPANVGAAGFITFERCAYGDVSNCRVITDTRGFSYEYYAVNFHSTPGEVSRSHISRQRIVLLATFSALARLSANVTGIDNERVSYARASIIFRAVDDGRLTGTQQTTTAIGGQIFTGGTIPG